MYTLTVYPNYIQVDKSVINLQDNISQLREVITVISVKFLRDICEDWNINKFVEEFEKTISYKDN